MSARTAVAALLLASCTTPAAQVAEPEQDLDAAQRLGWTQACEDWDEWDKPGPAFRIHGNTWYVGTCGIGAIFIAGNDGHVLIDSGTEAGAQVILDNLGGGLAIDPVDIRALLTSHDHFDHVGGMAVLQQASGAPVITSFAARAVLLSGVADPADPQGGMHEAMRPVPRVETLPADGVVRVGNLALTAIATPGHTPGALTWQWESCDDTVCRTIVYADSLSPISRDGYRFSDHPEYVAQFRAGLARLAALDCDILLTPHPSASGLRDKLLAGDLTGGQGCRAYATSISTRLDARLAEEAQAGG